MFPIKEVFLVGKILTTASHMMLQQWQISNKAGDSTGATRVNIRADLLQGIILSII